MTDCHLVAALRAPIGDLGKSLLGIPAPELGGPAVSSLIATAICASYHADQPTFGSVVQAGQGMNPAEQAAIRGGLPGGTPAYSVSRACASDLYSLVLPDQPARSDIPETAQAEREASNLVFPSHTRDAGNAMLSEASAQEGWFG